MDKRELAAEILQRLREVGAIKPNLDAETEDAARAAILELL